MAFINFKECGLQMSEKAQECPKCGDPNMRVRCKNCLEPIYTMDYRCPKCRQEEPLEGLNYKKTIFEEYEGIFIIIFFFILWQIVNFVHPYLK